MALQDQQRDLPESMFHEDANPGASASGILQWLMEHTGDLIHRAAFGEWGGGPSYGFDAVVTKAEKCLRVARRMGPGDPDDPWAQARRNYAYLQTPEGARFLPPGMPLDLPLFLAQARGALRRYAAAYRALRPLTVLQVLGRDAAIELGDERWGEYRLTLGTIVALLDVTQAGDAIAGGTGALERAVYYARDPGVIATLLEGDGRIPWARVLAARPR